MRRSLVMLTMVFILLAPVSQALGHGQTQLDPNDSAGPFDLVAARHGHISTGSGVDLRFKVVTYEAWDEARLSGTMNFIDLNIYEPDRGISACFRIRRAEAGSLVGQLYRKCYFNGVSEPRGEPIPVARPDGHSLVARFPRRLVAPRLLRYEWEVVTSYEDAEWPGCEPPSQLPPEHPYGTCADFSRRVRHGR